MGFTQNRGEIIVYTSFNSPNTLSHQLVLSFC